MTNMQLEESVRVADSMLQFHPVTKVARVLLFVYLFYHIYLHYDQVEQMHAFGFLLVFVVPALLAIMNLMWFGKIIKGLKKALAKRQ